MGRKARELLGHANKYLGFVFYRTRSVRHHPLLRLLRKIATYRSDFDRSTGYFDADRFAAEGSTGLGQRAPIPWHTPRARVAWRSGRRTAEQAPCSAGLVWSCNVGQRTALACSSPCHGRYTRKTCAPRGARIGVEFFEYKDFRRSCVACGAAAVRAAEVLKCLLATRVWVHGGRKAKPARLGAWRSKGKARMNEYI